MRLSKTLKLGLLLFLPESVLRALGVTAFCLLKSVDVTPCLTGAVENLHCPFWIQFCVEIYICSHFWQTEAAEKKEARIWMQKIYCDLILEFQMK